MGCERGLVSRYICYATVTIKSSYIIVIINFGYCFSLALCLFFCLECALVTGLLFIPLTKFLRHSRGCILTV